MSLFASHLLKIGPELAVQAVWFPLVEGQPSVEMNSGPFVFCTAGFSGACVLGLSPAGSFSSFHGRGCCKKSHPDNESLKWSLRKAGEYFPFTVSCNSVDGWRQRPRDSVRANGGHFE